MRQAISTVIYKVGQRWSILQRFKIWQSAIQVNWKDIEYFDENWKERIRLMSQFIPQGVTVLDLGSGREWLKEVVGENFYTGVDYTRRSSTTIVCEFVNSL